MKLIRIPHETGDEFLINTDLIASVRYAVTKKKGPEMALIRLLDGQTFEVRADLFDAELESAEAPVVAAAPPAPAKVEEPAKPVEVVKKRVTKSR